MKSLGISYFLYIASISSELGVQVLGSSVARIEGEGPTWVAIIGGVSMVDGKNRLWLIYSLVCS